ncbi:hypothetical protein BDQ17DRAFT_1543303 [Cyathus striatus]|nr:hypothetical protein BDQ17DRAFT_1543303 [Cyathus striatus]
MVSPVRRDKFSFHNNQFYVQVEDSDHKREDASKLYSLLTYVAPTGPVLTKAGNVPKHKPKPHKDPSPQFYRAQLIHYGLPELKTKPAVKKKLLAAFKDGPKGEKILEVPQSILDLERQMRGEWTKLEEEDLERKREQFRRVEEREKQEQEARTAARAIVCAYLPDEPPLGLESEYEVEEEEEEDNVFSEVPPFVVQTRKRFFGLDRAVAERLLDDIINEYWEVGSTLRKKMKDMAMYPDGKAARKYSGKPPPASNAIAGPSRESTVIDLAADSEGDVKPTEQTALKTTGSKRSRSPPSPRVQPAQKRSKSKSTEIPKFCTGSFKITIPSLAKNWPQHVEDENGETLTLGPSSTGSHLWGHFDFGIIHGYIRSVGPPPKHEGEKMYFTWRGRERGEDVMAFGDVNRGFVEFSAGGGQVTGAIKGSLTSQATFSGYRDSGPLEVAKWKKEFRLINQAGFEREGTMRWGTWVSEKAPGERAMDSDTTDGECSDDDSDEEPICYAL